jgi:hypothetical protein
LSGTPASGTAHWKMMPGITASAGGWNLDFLWCLEVDRLKLFFIGQTLPPMQHYPRVNQGAHITAPSGARESWWFPPPESRLFARPQLEHTVEALLSEYLKACAATISETLNTTEHK